MELVPAIAGTTCEEMVEEGDGLYACGESATVCDLDGPSDPTQGPRFFCKEHEPQERS